MSQSGPPKERNTVISVLGEIMDFKITGAETAGALCVVELTSFPHNGPPPHIHHREDESFYVVVASFRSSGEVAQSKLIQAHFARCSQGDPAHIPKHRHKTWKGIGHFDASRI